MNPVPEMPLVRSVLHPTDFSDASQAAFGHALSVSLRRETGLTLLHAAAGKPSKDTWTGFPSVRGMLERWGLLEADSPRSAVFEELKIKVQKVVLGTDKPLKAILEYVSLHSVDLIVMATQGRDGISRLLEGSTSEPLARQSQTMTLFVPQGARGFVDPATGEIDVDRIVVPVSSTPRPDAAIQFSTRVAQASSNEHAVITLLNVGGDRHDLELDMPEDPALSWQVERREGDVVDQILDVASKADLIAMVTEGRHGILDAFRGSTTERVVRNAKCPVLAVPATWVERLAQLRGA